MYNLDLSPAVFKLLRQPISLLLSVHMSTFDLSDVGVPVSGCCFCLSMIRLRR